MKKRLLALLLGGVLGLFALSGCGKPDTVYLDVFMPDGAPALVMAKLMHDENQLGRENVRYTVTAAGSISEPVIQREAAFVLMPVNAATLVAGSGEAYKLISVNTHGNLYIIGRGGAATLESLADDKASLAVVNLSNVPGLTLRHILDKKGIAYSTDGTAVAGAAAYIKLHGIDAENLAGQLEKTYDYVLAPEPAATTMTKKYGDVGILMDIQALYGGEYPQAVLLARSDVYEDAALVEAMLSALEAGEDAAWLANHISDAVTAVGAHMKDGAKSGISAGNMSAAVIENCNIRTLRTADAKAGVLAYVDRLIAVNPKAAAVPQDAFFG